MLSRHCILSTTRSVTSKESLPPSLLRTTLCYPAWKTAPTAMNLTLTWLWSHQSLHSLTTMFCHSQSISAEPAFKSGLLCLVVPLANSYSSGLLQALLPGAVFPDTLLRKQATSPPSPHIPHYSYILIRLLISFVSRD